ncbi:citryl-CoA lyase [Massilia sp. TS11]|uniref:citryl-CoA lyase n=1 Tax=Massilia sp. TS11 TaxID=2908003 RepID=UPI001EDA2284|nr:citryl-CoA lyase [Massilia sp. TS11]MCG2583305.1 citryl-CoA lyase [Massilia sp. TS11]
MSDIDPADVIHTRIWHEEPEPDNPFATRRALCRGYDVFGQMLGQARWVDMLLLLWRDTLPPRRQRDMLEQLALALANPGPRDPSVHAAMCGGVGGSMAAASLMAALAVGAGRSGGAREVFDAMQAWQQCGTHHAAWAALAAPAPCDPVEAFPDREHVPGFDPHGRSLPLSRRQLLQVLADTAATPRLQWLQAEADTLAAQIGYPLALSGIAAAAFADLELSPEAGELLFLLLRLPGAAAHALEQRAEGYRRFPFYQIQLDDAEDA